jgi:carboxyl-terminal processing protease
LRRGDLVVALDDRPLTGMAPADIHAAVGAANGERVVMDVIKEGNALRRMMVLKGPYRPPPLRVDAEVEPPLVRIPWFSAGVAEALRRSLTELDLSEGLVLDLRHNQGGLVEEVVAVASLLLPEGSVVYLRTGPDGQATPVRARGRRADVGRVVVLVDRGTAGPAELLVAALQDHRAARVIGVRTAGQGWIPSWTDLGSNLVLQLPDTGYRSPLGRSWNQRGLEPDVLVEAIDSPMSNGPGRVPVDVQRDTAIQLIKTP